MGEPMDQIKAKPHHPEPEDEHCRDKDPEYALEQNARLLRYNHIRDPFGAGSTKRGTYSGAGKRR
jgi:hypothetical protein